MNSRDADETLIYLAEYIEDGEARKLEIEWRDAGSVVAAAWQKTAADTVMRRLLVAIGHPAMPERDFHPESDVYLGNLHCGAYDSIADVDCGSKQTHDDYPPCVPCADIVRAVVPTISFDECVAAALRRARARTY